MPDARRSCAESSETGRHLKRRRHRDVLTHRVPDRAVLPTREIDGALNLIVGHVAGDREAQVNSDQPARLFLRARADEVGPQPSEIVPPFLEDVNEIHGHASRERERQRLHR